MIHICFPLYDKYGTYSKYEGVAICSVLENTNEDVMVHIIHDNTLSSENKNNFIQLVEGYKQKIYFYELDATKVFVNMESLKFFTVGTLFRLMITDILPSNIRKIIYLDADIVVNLDIKELWLETIGDCVVGACRDIDICENKIKNKLCDIDIIERENYFNAGVLLINLDKLKNNYNVLEDSLEFFSSYPQNQYADQDALNYLFHNDICYLDIRYNMHVKNAKQLSEKVSDKIYHFAGDPGIILGNGVFHQLFWHYLLKTPWGSKTYLYEFYKKRLQAKLEQIEWIKTSYRKIIGKKKIFFGSCGRIHRKIVNDFPMDEDVDYYVDNDAEKWSCIVNGVYVRNPLKLLDEDKNHVAIIVVSTYYEEIKQQLQGYGYIENENFFEGEKFLTENDDCYKF